MVKLYEEWTECDGYSVDGRSVKNQVVSKWGHGDSIFKFLAKHEELRDDSRICGMNVVVMVVKCKRHYEIAVFLDYSDSVIIFNCKSFM